MSVPGHDDRDKEFAEKYKLPIISVYENELTINSGEFDGLEMNVAKEKIVDAIKVQLSGVI